ncbi:MAG: hypothetical protein ACTHOD_03550 [Motilibacteraceae bacterium]
MVIPREGDLAIWALDLAAQALTDRADQPDNASRTAERDSQPREMLASHLLILAHQVRRSAPDLAFALLPLEEAGSALVVEVLAFELPEGTTDAEVLAPLLIPADEFPDEPEISTVPSDAGPAMKVRQRWAFFDPDRKVAETTTYLWQLPEQHALVVAQANIVDLDVAARSQAALDELARGFTKGPA